MKKERIIKVILIMFTILILFCNYKVECLSDPVLDPNSWKPNTNEEPILNEKTGRLLGSINVIGIISSVIALAIIGLKYIFGSVEEKADYKKSLGPYFIGIVLLVAATSIPNIIYIIVEGIF